MARTYIVGFFAISFCCVVAPGGHVSVIRCELPFFIDYVFLYNVNFILSTGGSGVYVFFLYMY